LERALDLYAQMQRENEGREKELWGIKRKFIKLELFKKKELKD